MCVIASRLGCHVPTNRYEVNGDISIQSGDPIVMQTHPFRLSSACPFMQTYSCKPSNADQFMQT